MKIRIIFLGMSLALSGMFISGAATAQAQHSHSQQALSELNTARQMLLQYTDGKPMTHNEKEALRQINVVIKDLTDAAISNKLTPSPPQDAASLQACIALIKQAKQELAQEDTQFANGLRDRSVKNCDEAIKFVEQDMPSGQNK